MLHTPVALIIFRRPQLTKRVFDVIMGAKPSKLFLIADGPSPERPGEAEKCAAARAVVENVSWDCEVFRDYSETNMGFSRRIASGITSAFQEVEELIVLEDDCIPDPSFFRFCDELLERYRDDERIMHIAGNHFQAQDPRPTPYSYSFAWHNIAWGYATWRRAWHHFDLGIPSWGELRDTDFLDQMVGVPLAVELYRKIFDQLYATTGEIDGYDRGVLVSWDWAWSFACWSQRGLSVLPDRTLVQNVGFGPDSSNFLTADDPRARFQSMPMRFPLNHPPYVLRDTAADNFINNTYVAPQISLPRRICREIKRTVAPVLPTPIRQVGSKVVSGVRATLHRSTSSK